jgi:hypothetical protein
MTPELTSLGEVLKRVAQCNPNHFLYLSREAVWRLDTRAVVLSESPADGVPELARDNNLSYALQVAAVQDVVANAAAQLKGPPPEQLLRALRFYYDHDAFICFSPTDQ